MAFAALWKYVLFSKLELDLDDNEKKITLDEGKVLTVIKVVQECCLLA